MYIKIWSKYRPIIKILLKRSAGSDQVLEMNRIDFERAGIGRKAGYKFNIEFSKGRVDNFIGTSPLAKDLATVLLEDESIKSMFLNNDYQLTLNSKYQLGVKYRAVPQPDPAIDAAGEKN